MELLAPAGNFEKLKTVYNYGADAAYIGINNFSLRQKADNFTADDFIKIKEIKGDKLLFGAFNISFHNRDISRFIEQSPLIREYPLDAFIISDIGLVPILKKEFPNTALHLSTQANCINKYSAKLYQEMGFSRVILGREASLDEIKEIKDFLPDLELETFVHGAMCLAYSGRCFLSRYMADRSANKGSCAHTCRWQYKLKSQSGDLALEEELRPGEYYPIFEGDDFTTILSSRDLCLIDHLQPLVDAGINSFKIEGRMKSLYYAAIITRAYHKAIDQIKGIEVNNFKEYREEIFKVSHREFTTGFFFGDNSIESPTTQSYLRKHIFVGTISELVDSSMIMIKMNPDEFIYEIDLKNQIKSQDFLEYIGPNQLYIQDKCFSILNEKYLPVTKSDHGKITYIKTNKILKSGFIIRRAIKQKEDPLKNRNLHE